MQKQSAVDLPVVLPTTVTALWLIFSIFIYTYLVHRITFFLPCQGNLPRQVPHLTSQAGWNDVLFLSCLVSYLFSGPPLVESSLMTHGETSSVSFNAQCCLMDDKKSAPW